jgi:hypothetical protein
MESFLTRGSNVRLASRTTLAFCAVLMAGCSSSPTGKGSGSKTTRHDAGANSFANADAGSGSSTGSAKPVSCAADGDCMSGQFCASTGVCLTTGQCRADADCTAPKRCAPMSRTCLDAGACAVDGDCDMGKTCNTGTSMCEIGGGCGQSVFQITALPPNVMILLDRSGSMDNDAGGDTRWNVAVKAIDMLTLSFDDKIRFGLDTFSSCLPGGCSAGSIIVPIAAMNGGAIRDFLATTVDQRSSDGQQLTSAGKIKYLCDSGDPETSTGKSLTALAGEPTLQDASRTNAIILLTDGEESKECVDGCNGSCGAAKLLAQSPSVKTYAIGLGVNTSAIDAIAKAGGTDHAIGASNQAELAGAFTTTAAAVASCDYTLDKAPPDADKLYVFFNKDPTVLPRDGADGWSYDTATRRLQFVGSACASLQAGTITHVDVVYGCPLLPVE